MFSRGTSQIIQSLATLVKTNEGTALCYCMPVFVEAFILQVPNAMGTKVQIKKNDRGNQYLKLFDTFTSEINVLVYVIPRLQCMFGLNSVFK